MKKTRKTLQVKRYFRQKSTLADDVEYLEFEKRRNYNGDYFYLFYERFRLKLFIYPITWEGEENLPDTVKRLVLAAKEETT